MIKAKEKLLAHTTTNTVVNIQNIELQYFVTFFTTIGLQCAFIATFQIRTISQVPIGRLTTTESVVSLAYWIAGSISISLGFFGFLMCLYIRVFGQYLAIHGPPGSVLKAIQIFLHYQHMIITTFSYNIVALAISAGFEFYVFMKLNVAIVTTFIIAISARVWYHYCWRIYNYNAFKEDWDANATYYRDPKCTVDQDIEPQYRPGTMIPSQLAQSMRSSGSSMGNSSRTSSLNPFDHSRSRTTSRGSGGGGSVDGEHEVTARASLFSLRNTSFYKHFMGSKSSNSWGNNRSTVAKNDATAANNKKKRKTQELQQGQEQQQIPPEQRGNIVGVLGRMRRDSASTSVLASGRAQRVGSDGSGGNAADVENPRRGLYSVHEGDDEDVEQGSGAAAGENRAWENSSLDSRASGVSGTSRFSAFSAGSGGGVQMKKLVYR